MTELILMSTYLLVLYSYGVEPVAIVAQDNCRYPVGIVTKPPCPD